MSGSQAIIPLAEATRRMSSVLGFEPRALTLDAITARLPSFVWASFPDREIRGDLDIAERSGLLRKPMMGNLLIVTEASFDAGGGAFVLEGTNLGTFIDTHLLRYGECFFNGDVIILALEGKEVWLFHHEGVYMHAMLT
jgi:hypothetical protein